MTNNVPNLDTMHIDELFQFYFEHAEGGNYLDLFPAEAIPAGMTKTAYTTASKTATANLANAAINCMTAIKLATKGEADKAHTYNLRAKEYYDALPAWAHWVTTPSAPVGGA